MNDHTTQLNLRAGKVLGTIVLSRVLATLFGVPFDSDPFSFGRRDDAKEADSTPIVVDFNTLAYFQLGRFCLDDHFLITVGFFW